jgi:peptide/nickel transport system substrate-binding protein
MQSTAQSNTTSTSCSSNDIFKWTLVGTPTSLNPLTFITGTGYVWELEYPGFTDYLWNGSQVSYMLGGWSHNANYTQWIFNVKPGLTWSNGVPVNATDILVSEGPKFAFNLAYNFELLAQIFTGSYALNSSAAVFNLNASDAHMIDQASLDGQGGTPVLPASVIQANGASFPNLGTDISMGPFYVSNYTVSSTQMVMYRNPYFKPLPNICEIQVSFVDSLSLTAKNLEAGQADLAPIDPSTASAILSVPNLRILDEKSVGAASLEYNDSIFPYNQLAFRQALVYGINQSEFVQQAYAGYGVTAYNAESAVPTTAGTWFNPNVQQYNFNATKASQLLASIGYTKDTGGKLHYPNGTLASLTLWTDTDNTEDLTGATVVQQNLQALGFTVNTQTTTQANIAADYGANSNGIRNALLLFSGFVLNPPHPLVDALPACAVEWLPPVCSHHFLQPDNVDAEYNSNFSAFMGTDNPAQMKQYLFNIQSLEASSLPTTILAYPDFLWGYSVAHWTNWPNPVTGHMDEGLAEVPNMTAWTSLAPLATSTSTSSGGSSSLVLYAAIAIVVAVIIIIAGGLLYSRRKRVSGQKQ